LSNFQEELRNDDGYENIVIIAVGQTNISEFNNNFCANSDLPLVMDTHPDLPIREQFSPYGEPHYLVILNYDGDYIGHIDLLSLGNTEKDYIRGVLQDYYQESYTGDINQDSLVNIQDVILVINLILNVDFNLLADINLDDNVDVLDVIQLVNIILN
tara:strand:- start:367 stop:837 length:471 start_codon:yes stop_codon:yes gene_type:complete